MNTDKTKGQLIKEPEALHQHIGELEKLEAKHKQAVEQLRGAEKHYRSVLDGIPEGCMIIGFDWRYLYVNDVATRHVCRAKEELLGHTVMEMYPGIEDTEMFAQLWRCMEERIPDSVENEFTYPGGAKRWFELNIKPVPEGIFILSLDITERKRVEEALRESEGKYRGLVSNVKLGVFRSTPRRTGKFSYYRCNNALRHDPEACRSGWLPKNKIEGFIIDRVKENVLTDDNLTTLVKMVNEEIRLLAGHRQERLEEIDKQFESVNQKLAKYYAAFEKGTMSADDAAPRIRELRSEQTRLQRARDEALSELEDTEPKELGTERVLDYVKDFKALLSKGTFVEQKAFLRSFIKRIDFEPGQVAINYTIPVPVEKGKTSEREVLSIEQSGGPFWARTRDLSLIRTAL